MKIISHIFLISLSFFIALKIFFLLLPQDDTGDYKNIPLSCIEYTYDVKMEYGQFKEKNLLYYDEIDFNKVGLSSERRSYTAEGKLKDRETTQWLNWRSEKKEFQKNNKISGSSSFVDGYYVENQLSEKGKITSGSKTKQIFVSDDRKKKVYKTWDSETDSLLYSETYWENDLEEDIRYEVKFPKGEIVFIQEIKYVERDEYNNWISKEVQTRDLREDIISFRIVEREIEYSDNLGHYLKSKF
jgi:hypothetical protein